MLSAAVLAVVDAVVAAPSNGEMPRQGRSCEVHASHLAMESQMRMGQQKVEMAAIAVAVAAATMLIK